MRKYKDRDLVSRLARALRQQRAELGDIASELILLLVAASLGGSNRTTIRSGGMSPVDGVGAKRKGAR